MLFNRAFGLVLPRFTVEQIHLWTGIALPIPIIVSLLGPWGRTMRRDLRRVNRWTRAEIQWVRSRGRAPLRADKFNPGQKLNVIFVGASVLVMLVTGVILKWFSYFPVSWRPGATLVHDVIAYAIAAVVTGHIIMALTHRDALSSMFSGRVKKSWADVHAPAWLPGERTAPDHGESAPTVDESSRSPR